jgi:hypothetical protein
VSMKNCDYCGCENADEADSCCECGTAFSASAKGQAEPGMTQSEFSEWFGQPVSWRVKVWSWYGAWGVVVLINLALNPGNLLAAPFFPLGLIALFSIEMTITSWMLGAPAIILGWIVYILLSAVMNRMKTKGAFFLIYLIFCVVLALNISGCQKAIESVKGIH